MEEDIAALFVFTRIVWKERAMTVYKTIPAICYQNDYIKKNHKVKKTKQTEVECHLTFEDAG